MGAHLPSRCRDARAEDQQSARRPTMKSCVVALCFVLAGASMTEAVEARHGSVKVCVIAYKGAIATRAQWQPTADYLNDKIPARTFEIFPLTVEEAEAAADRCDFVISNPGHYVALEASHGATRIATRRRAAGADSDDEYGAVIFTRAQRTDVNVVGDLRGKRFMAVGESSFGGWWIAWRELSREQIDPGRDLSLYFAGEVEDNVVYAVRDKRTDAGTVPTGHLERMAAAGQIALTEFRVLNLQAVDSDHPFLRSTQLYPEWPIATFDHAPNGPARDVAIALLQMPSAGPAAIAAQASGWTIPLDYRPVHELLRELNLPPYADYGRLEYVELASTEFATRLRLTGKA